MKLGKVTHNDPVQRLALSIHASVSDALKRYQRYYTQSTGDEISMSQLSEEILKRFMRDDKDFQKYLSTPDNAPASAEARP